MIDQLALRRDARPFAKPMVELWTEEVMVEYRTIIKHPMDLRTVLEKLRRGEYNDGGPEAFADDVRLVWQNCMTYIVRCAAAALLACLSVPTHFAYQGSGAHADMTSHHLTLLHLFRLLAAGITEGPKVRGVQASAEDVGGVRDKVRPADEPAGL